jgi:hypothetical protein
MRVLMGYSSGCISTVGIQLTLVADSDEKGILGAVGNKPKRAPSIWPLAVAHEQPECSDVFS